MKFSYFIQRDFEITAAEAILIMELYDMRKEYLAIKFINGQYAELDFEESKKLCEAVNNPKQ
jgi:hypothetical protein